MLHNDLPRLNKEHIAFRSSAPLYVNQLRICRITKCYIHVHIAGVDSSAVYTDVLDICRNIDRTAKAVYLTSPDFPADYRGTGLCMCTMKPVLKNWFRAAVRVEHVMLSDSNVWNEAFSIFTFKRGNNQQTVMSECSPSQIKRRNYSFPGKEIRVLFHRKIATNASDKSAVWLGIRGMFIEICPISWWRHTMYVFSAPLTLCEGNLARNLLVNDELPYKRPRNGAHWCFWCWPEQTLQVVFQIITNISETRDETRAWIRNCIR